MNKILTLILLPVPNLLMGQTDEPDTMAVHHLDEITVVASNQLTNASKTVYLPSETQRKSASGGVSLLARMNIPQLSVNPLSDVVKTAADQSVSLFINYHQASKEDVAGLNPMNVRRIEYLEFPVDPRFMRAQFVINFITRNIDMGGYTKIAAKERFLVNSGIGSVYSKFNFKAMEYDLMLEGGYDRNSHTGSSSWEIYRLNDRILERVSTFNNGKYRQRDVFAAFRASWNKSEKFAWRNMLSFNNNKTPTYNSSGCVEISDFSPSEIYSESSSLNNFSSAWESELYAVMGKGWSINADIQASYSKNESFSNYSASSTLIVNDAHELSWNLRANIQIDKTFTDKLGLFANILAGYGRSEIRYSGSSDATNIFRPVFSGAALGASLNIGKLSGSIDAGFASEWNTINDDRVNDSYPYTHINLQYAPKQRNSLSLWFQYAAFSPDAAMKNPNTIRLNEILYVSGNPNLHCSNNIAANISYTFLPNNRWQLSSYATFFQVHNRQVAIYSPDGPQGTMLKKYFNDGDYNHGQIGARLTGKFFNGKLACSVAPRLLLYHTTGANSTSYYPFDICLNVDYYLGTFFFNALWHSPGAYLDGETCYKRKTPSECALSVGWADKGWNIEISLVNIFRRTWTLSNDTFKSHWFDSTIRQYGSDYHQRISVAITYTFTYGKKVSAGSEMQKSGGASSSILR